MGQFKPMVKMMTTEPTVELKLKKGGAVTMKKGGSTTKAAKMAGGGAPMMGALRRIATADEGMAPAKPSMASRRSAMGRMADMKAKKRGSPMARMAAMGRKEGGETSAEHAAEMKKMAGTAKELKEHKSMPASKAHKGLATGGVAMGQGGYKHGGKTKKMAMGGTSAPKPTAPKGMAAPYIPGQGGRGLPPPPAVKPMMGKKVGPVPISDPNYPKPGIGPMPTSRPAPPRFQEELTPVPKSLPTPAMPSRNVPLSTSSRPSNVPVGDKARYMKKGGGSKKYAAGGIIKSTSGETKMVTAKPDHSSAKTGGVKLGNAGGYKKGGSAKYAKGGGVEGNVSTAHAGVTNTETGGVRKGNAGGYAKGGASKKFARGGSVNDSGKPEGMAQGRKKPPTPVSISRLSGTYKKGGAAKMAEGGDTDVAEQKRLKAMEKAYNESGKVSAELEEAMNPLSMMKEAFDKAKGLFRGKPSGESVTKTKESVTVTPLRKRYGGAC